MVDLSFVYATRAAGIVAILRDATCPIALARQHHMTIYIVLLANALTYALAGLVVETMLPPTKRPLKQTA
jgi:hypothetical protein